MFIGTPTARLEGKCPRPWQERGSGVGKWRRDGEPTQTEAMTASLPDLDLDLDPDLELELLHDRQYSVRVYRKNHGELLARGQVRDVKPAGLYVEGDPDPLVLHHMVVDLTVAHPSYEITGAEVVFDTYPQPTCPAISAGYQQLVGLSVAAGSRTASASCSADRGAART